jgi:hypothetical protein
MTFSRWHCALRTTNGFLPMRQCLRTAKKIVKLHSGSLAKSILYVAHIIFLPCEIFDRMAFRSCNGEFENDAPCGINAAGYSARALDFRIAACAAPTT